jgi:hypothetical protein
MASVTWAAELTTFAPGTVAIAAAAGGQLVPYCPCAPRAKIAAPGGVRTEF